MILLAYSNDFNKYQQLYEQEKQRFSKKGLSYEAQRIRESYEMQIKAAKDSVTIETLKNEMLLKLQRISNDAYLNALKDFAQEEKDTFKALKNNISDIYSDIAKIADEKIGSVIASQQKLEDKLSSYGSKFTHHTVYGGGDNGEDLSFYLLQDYAQTNRELTEYYNAINSVKERLKGNGFESSVASDFMSIMADMSIPDGSNFANLLVSSSDSQFRQFVNGYLENQKLSKEISTALYADDMARATQETVSYMKSELEKLGLEVPEGFTLSGSLSAQNFGAAFVSELENQLADIRAMVADFNSNLVISDGSSSSFRSTKAANNVTYNQNFTVGTSKDSVFEQITAWKNATVQARLRGQ